MIWRGSGLLFAVTLCAALLTLAAPQTTNPTEVSALRAIKSSLVDRMKHLRNWNKGDPCTSNWTGVLCFGSVADDGYLHVQVIQLLNKNLSGSLAPELGHLSYLTILDFMWNELHGNIPKEIGSIGSLKLLLLNGNKLSGGLPDELGNLSQLTRLQVDENQISGPIPKSFSNLKSIRHLHLNNNSISGPIPPDLSNVTTLLHLLLDNNNISGDIPSEFSTLPNLRILQLDNNDFNGAEIPASYGNLSRLVKLSLRNCNLQGAVPDLRRIQNLSYLDLGWNQLTGSIPPYKLSENMTTIDLSNNRLNGSIPESFLDLPLLQRLSLENNMFSGSVSINNAWQNKSFSSTARLMLDFRNNPLLNISGDLNPPDNVTLRLQGNPICGSTNIGNIKHFCGSEVIGDKPSQNTNNSTIICYIQSCPLDDNYEYVPKSPIPCFCASPIRVGYRLKSPSFSYFPPYLSLFEEYVTSSLNLDLYQLFVDSPVWEAGRLRMNLKLFPRAGVNHSQTFNTSEILRIRGIFASWVFPGSDFFGPYELLNFTLLGPYSYVNAETRARGISKGMLIAVVIVAIACAVTITAIMTVFITRRHARYLHTLSRKHLSSKLSIKIDGVKRFTFEEMAAATHDFSSSSLVGQGGYGKVYRGILFDKTLVAIKRAKEGSLQGEKEFLTEIEILSRLHHRNLVSLVGYCDEEEEQMLVYEFMPNGTLREWLSAKSVETLSFGMRLDVALDSAKGILYLHTEASPPIFHRDIKASNILLDSKLTAKVADFGLSRLAPVQEDDGTIANHVSTLVKGTPGYIDPEYFLTRMLTDKSDVYSLGVVFLEILTGMQPIWHGKNIVREVNLAHQSGTMFSIIDSKMGSYPSECVERFVALALRCCHEKPEGRPSMLDIVRELENILQTMPEKGVDSVGSRSRSRYSGESSSSLSLHHSSRGSYVSTNVLGSDLVSGVVPIITPR